MKTPVLTGDVTRLLQAWKSGDRSALERLTPLVYGELHRIALRRLAGEREGHILQPTALVNEAFLRLLGSSPVDWANRAHFFGFSARLMRHILIDIFHTQDAKKRGNREPHVHISAVSGISADQADPVDLIDLDNALNQLSQLDERQAKLVELRYFGGLDNAEIAAVLGISEATVVRDWRIARAWLFQRLKRA